MFELEVNKNHENHIFAIESYSDGFSPRRFSIDSNEEIFAKISS
jgi:hypothetical protein